jgi:hypothetical protein
MGCEYHLNESSPCKLLCPNGNDCRRCKHMRKSPLERVNTVLRRVTVKRMNVPTDVEQRKSESKDLNVPAAVEPWSSGGPKLKVDVRSEAAAAAERSSDERELVLDTGTDISEAHAIWI